MTFRNKQFSLLVLILITTISICQASSCCPSEAAKAESKCEKPKSPIAQNPSKPPLECDKTQKNEKEKPLDEILDKLTASNKSLRTYRARILYTFVQDPELINSVTVRTGNIYYKKGKNRSDLLIAFNTLKQDDGPKEKHLVKYLFDGVFLRIIDYQNKTINTYQKARKNSPKDAFQVIASEFPMVGFTQPELLKREFDISLLEKTKAIPANVIPIKLVVKKGSIYEEDYKSIDFWVDKATFLPARLLTMAVPEPGDDKGDMYEIILTDSKINKKLPKAIFKLETPKDFSETITPMEK